MGFALNSIFHLILFLIFCRFSSFLSRYARHSSYCVACCTAYSCANCTCNGRIVDPTRTNAAIGIWSSCSWQRRRRSSSVSAVSRVARWFVCVRCEKAISMQRIDYNVCRVKSSIGFCYQNSTGGRCLCARVRLLCGCCEGLRLLTLYLCQWFCSNSDVDGFSYAC